MDRMEGMADSTDGHISYNTLRRVAVAAVAPAAPVAPAGGGYASHFSLAPSSNRQPFFSRIFPSSKSAFPPVYGSAPHFDGDMSCSYISARSLGPALRLPSSLFKTIDRRFGFGDFVRETTTPLPCRRPRRRRRPPWPPWPRRLWPRRLWPRRPTRRCSARRATRSAPVPPAAPPGPLPRRCPFLPR